MAGNSWTLTTPITEANMTKFKVVRVTLIDEDNQIMSFELQLQGGGGVLFGGPGTAGRVFAMSVTNGGGCDALAVNPSPATLLDTIVQCRLTPASTPTAYTTVSTAYLVSGSEGTRFGALLTALAGISGVASGGPSNGQTIPIIPAGTNA